MNVVLMNSTSILGFHKVLKPFFLSVYLTGRKIKDTCTLNVPEIEHMYSTAKIMIYLF